MPSPISIQDLYYHYNPGTTIPPQNIQFNQLYAASGLGLGGAPNGPPIYERGELDGVEVAIPAAGQISLGNFVNRFNSAGAQNYTTQGSTLFTVPRSIFSISVSYYPFDLSSVVQYRTQSVAVTPGQQLSFNIGAEGAPSTITVPSTGQQLGSFGAGPVEVFAFSGNVDAYFNMYVGIADGNYFSLGDRRVEASGPIQGGTSFFNQMNGYIGATWSQGDHGDLGGSIKVQAVQRGRLDPSAARSVFYTYWSGRDSGNRALSFNYANGYLTVNQGDGQNSEGSYSYGVGLQQRTHLYTSWFP